jgi:hypothetical protein
LFSVFQPSAAKTLCDLDKNKEKEEEDGEKKEGMFGLRTDMYAKRALHVSLTSS